MRQMEIPVHGKAYALQIANGETSYPFGVPSNRFLVDLLNGVHGITEQQLQEWWDEEKGNTAVTFIPWKNRNDLALSRNYLHSCVHSRAWKEFILPTVKDDLLQLIDSMYDGDVDKSDQFASELAKLVGIPVYEFYQGEQCYNCKETYSCFSVTFPRFLMTDQEDRICEGCLAGAGLHFNKEEITQS